MAKVKIRAMGGNASHKGFFLRCTIAVDKKEFMSLCKESSGYKRVSYYKEVENFLKKISKIKLKFVTVIMSFTLLAVAAMVMNYFWYGHGILYYSLFALMSLATIPSCASSIYILYEVFAFYRKDCIEWHAVEHKTARLLEKYFLDNENINMEKLERMHRVTLTACRSPYHVGPIVFYTLIIYALLLNSFWILFANLIIFPIAAYLAQFFLLTSKPSKDKLEEGLRVARELNEKGRFLLSNIKT